VTRDDQLNQLILHEGTGPVKRGRLMPYTDTTGHLTVGYGRNLDANGVRESEARLMLSNDLTDAIDECRAKFPWYDALDPVRQAVVAELLFNMGYPTLAKFTNTLAAIERGDWLAAGEGLRKSKWYQQVRARRGHRLVTQLEGGFWE
jgi:lysozyme